jgi:putative CRISPR-associated protein (TIGR02619 family)
LARALAELDPTNRFCGAEINSITAYLAGQSLKEPRKLVFFVSDTEDGQTVGEILKAYYEEQGLRDKNISIRTVTGLKDSNPKEFKNQGLTNLVREIAGALQTEISENVVFNATGGYKAQIALAVVLGQVTGIPVYYKHESFKENSIIEFPPLPVDFDYSHYGEFMDIFDETSRGGSVTLPNDERDFRVVSSLFEEIEVEGQREIALNPIGTIYWESARRWLAQAEMPKDLSDGERKKPRLPDHNFPTGYPEFVDKVWQENQWIVTIDNLPYSKQGQLQQVTFYVEGQAGGGEVIIGTYCDRDNFGARFKVVTSETNARSLIKAADLLNRKYARNS